jgi:general secretion pathway protein A
MYLSHFGLHDEPFRLTPDPSRLYLGTEHREAVAALRYGVLGRRGLVMLVGEVGTGKTTIAYDLLHSLDDGVRAAYVSFTYQQFPGVLADALTQLGANVPADASIATLVRLLNAHVRREAEADRTTAIIIDEAQHLGDEAFEQLRLLSNCETHCEKLLQIVLVGQPELEERLSKPELRQVRERIAVRAVLHPLSRVEMRKYLDHRVRAAGGAGLDRLFTEQAIRAVVAHAGGIPRRANIVCHNALFFAYGRGCARVDRRIAREAAAELRRIAPSRRGGARSETWRVAAALAAVAMLGTAAWSLRPERSGASVAAATDRAAPAPVVSMVMGTTEAPADAVPAPEPAIGETPVPAVACDPTPAPPVACDPTAAARQDRAEPIVANPAPPPTTLDEALPVTLDVPAGATLSELAYRVYGRQLGGRTLPDVFQEIQRVNPGLHDVGFIMAGERLRFPVLVSSARPQG